MMDQAANGFKERVALPLGVRDHLGALLRQVYMPLHIEAPPEAIAALLQRLETTLEARGETLTTEVRDGLLANLPGLRGFAMSLTRDHSSADDLLQATMLRAWKNRDKYQAGTNIAAWLFTIMRNAFYSEQNRKRREVEDPDGAFAAQISVAPTQGHSHDVADVWRALAQLPDKQRDALILVAIEDLSYDDAAMVMGCEIGTIKSRVSRARQRLNEVLSYTSIGVEANGLAKGAIGASDHLPSD